MIDSNLYIASQFVQDTIYSGKRLKYPGEGGNYNPDGMPGVTPALRMTENGRLKYITPVKMTERIQNIIWDVMKIKNPSITPDKFTQTLHTKIALTNGAGFGDPNKPKANFITGDNKTSPLPKLMDGIIMAGQLYQGDVVGDALVMKPGKHAMDANNLVSAATAIKNGWVFKCVSWHDKQGGYGEDFFPLRGGEYYVPHIISEIATYPIMYFDEWERSYPPDPLKLGG